MSKVIDIASRRKDWEWSYVKCQHCGYEWTAVYPAEAGRLQCPHCAIIDEVMVWSEQRAS